MNETKENPVQASGVAHQQKASVDLKAAREARGLSLHDVFLATRVSTINLTAVENQAFDQLPPPVYAREFIKKYCRVIGIDEKPLLESYERHLESLKPAVEEKEVREPWPENGRRHRFLIISLASLLIAGILVYGLFLYVDQSGKMAVHAPAPAVEPPAAPEQTASAVAEIPGQLPAASSPQMPAAPSPQMPAVPSPQIATAPKPPETAPAVKAKEAEPAAIVAKREAAPPATAAGKRYRLVIETRELTWMRITEDGTSRQEVTLKPGERVERMASEFFQLDIGNAGGIDLIFQGKSLGELGKRGQIIHLRLPEPPAAQVP